VLFADTNVSNVPPSPVDVIRLGVCNEMPADVTDAARAEVSIELLIFDAASNAAQLFALDEMPVGTMAIAPSLEA
jgi:hypothetical protein